jgi:hypothetical protein
MAQGPYGGQSSLFNNMEYKSVRFAHPPPEGGSQAVLHALNCEKNLKHKILRELDSYADEKTFVDPTSASANTSKAPSNEES